MNVKVNGDFSLSLSLSLSGFPAKGARTWRWTLLVEGGRIRIKMKIKEARILNVQQGRWEGREMRYQ